MFALTWGQGQNLGTPDTCMTPAAPSPVPVPYPNISMTSTCANASPKVLIECMPTLNLMSTCAMSQGDEAGSLLGVATGMVMGPTIYLAGCTGVTIDGQPAQRLTSVTGHNCMATSPNAPGSTIAPSQETVLCLK